MSLKMDHFVLLLRNGHNSTILYASFVAMQIFPCKLLNITFILSCRLFNITFIPH